MADDHILPATGETVRSTQLASGAKVQHVLAGIFPSTDNTTTTPLGSGLTYTGTGEVAPTDGVTVSCQTDNTGTLYFDFSVDGTNWGAFPTNGFDVASGIHEYHTAKVNGRYFRVRLVNDSGAQTYLRLYTYFGPHTAPNAPLNQTLGGDADAILVRPTSPMIDQALGRLGGRQTVRKFGYHNNLGTAVQLGNSATWQHLWAYQGIRTSPTSSFTPYVASSSASDTSVVTIEYLDANGVSQLATPTLTGQTPVSLGVTATEAFRGWNSGATAFVGQITCTTANNFTAGVPDNQNEVLIAIPINDGQSQVLAYRVPANEKAILEVLSVTLTRSSGAAGSAICALQIRESGGVWRTIMPFQPNTGGQIVLSLEGVVLDAGTDIRLQIRDVSGASSAMSGTLIMTLVDV